MNHRLLFQLTVGLSSLTFAATQTTSQPEAHTESTQIPELVVAAKGPWDVHELDTSSINDFLKNLPLLVLNQQGTGAQTDLQIRGSSFSESGLAIGPLALRNPQTEHFNANLPLPGEMFTSAKVLVGLESSLNGSSHLAGTVRLTPTPVGERKTFTIQAAENGELAASTYVEHPIAQWTDAALGLAAFASWSDLSRGLDYPDNTLKTKQYGTRIQWLGTWHQTDVIIGHETREFGARGFYGVTPTLAALEKTQDTLLMALGQADSEAVGDIEFAIYWREFQDEYALPEIDYLNKHQSTNLALALTGATPLADTNQLTLQWTTTLENETLKSDNLGDHQRRSAALALAPEITLEKLTFTVGATGHWFSHEPPWFGTLAGIRWTPNQRLELFAEYVENIRRPSYTELNYESPASLGNAGLENEQAKEISGGIRLKNDDETLTIQFAIFQRDTTETIDWIKDDPSNAWQAENIGDVRTRGLELTAGWKPNSALDAELVYTWLQKHSATDVEIGRYILDYPRHDLTLGLDWHPIQWLELRTNTTLRHQTDSDMRTSDRTAVWLNAEVVFTHHRFQGGQLSIFCDNALDDDFQDIAGQRPTGRRFGIAYTHTL